VSLAATSGLKTLGLVATPDLRALDLDIAARLYDN